MRTQPNPSGPTYKEAKAQFEAIPLQRARESSTRTSPHFGIEPSDPEVVKVAKVVFGVSLGLWVTALVVAPFIALGIWIVWLVLKIAGVID